jgi:sec-independent protein translocase protein TatC
MEESEALGAARSAMETDDPEKAQAILDRFDAAEAAAEEAAEAEEDGEASDDAEEENVFSRTAQGMVGAFTDEDDEDDLGGYYYDLRFIFDSLRSRAFRLVVVFGAVMSAAFLALYSGGIGLLYEDFLARLPPGVSTDEIAFSVITLHPVEALVFMVKLSVVLGAVAVVPFLLYYAWPALSERGIATGDRRVLAVWGGVLFGGLLAGSALGYMVIAPEVISWLVYDAIREGMRVSYRVSSFFWLIFLLTVGIGLLVDVPLSMLLFHFGGLVSYRTMHRGWKVFVLAALVVGALLTPGSVYTMLVVAIPTVLAYFLGLGTLWVLTLGGRTTSSRPQVE